MFYKSKTAAEAGADGVVFEDKDYPPVEAFERVNQVSKKRKFDESVEVMVKLAVDPTKGD